MEQPFSFQVLFLQQELSLEQPFSFQVLFLQQELSLERPFSFQVLFLQQELSLERPFFSSVDVFVEIEVLGAEVFGVFVAFFVAPLVVVVTLCTPWYFVCYIVECI